MSSSFKSVQRKVNIVYVCCKRYAQKSRRNLINYSEYASNEKAVASIKLKYGTENETKRKYLTGCRDRVDGDMQSLAKYMYALKDKRNQIHYKKSIAVLDKCVSDGFKPNLVLFSKVIDNCAKSSAPNMVGVKILEDMIITFDIKPNYIILSSLLNQFYKNKCYQDAIVLFGLSTQIISVNLSSLLKDYEKSREISYILNNQLIVDNLKQIQCNIICINIVLRCIGALGDTSKLNECLQAMFAADMMPNDVTLNTMINIYGNNQKLSKMETLFEWWHNNQKLLQFAPDIITINSMLATYAKLNQFDKCEQLFNKYCSKEHNKDDAPLLSPTVITFSHMVSCIGKCIEHGDDSYKMKMRDNALKYYKQMQVIYGINDRYNSCTTALMNVCLKCHDLVTMMTVFEECRVKHRSARQLYHVAIRGLFYEGMIGEALSLFEEGVEHNALTYLSKTNGPYSMDLHHFDVATAVIAIMHNLKTLCNTITARVRFKIPSIWIIVGRGNNTVIDGKSDKQVLLKDAIPEMLRDERLFYPKLDNFIPSWNEGIIKLDDECLLKYVAHQLKQDINELRPRFQSAEMNESDLTFLSKPKHAVEN